MTLKNHKESYDNHPTARLINPAKNELERIHKLILDKINNKNQSKIRAESMKKY